MSYSVNLPPLSPWQLSIPPAEYPAHSILSVMRLLYDFLHSCVVTIGTWASCKICGVDPPLESLPHPVM